jgi:hypothetical protein
VEAVAGEFVRRDVVAEVAGLCALGEQVPDEVSEVLLGPGDVLASMQDCHELGAVVPELPWCIVPNERVGLQDRVEPLAGVAGSVAKFGQPFKVAADLTLVPCGQDRFDAGQDRLRQFLAPPPTPVNGRRTPSC